MFGSGDRYALLSGHQGIMVVVEDPLSAIAVNRAGWPCTAILGTQITPTVAASLDAPIIIGWFDDDDAGQAAWVTLRKRMGLYPGALMRIQTDRDPKHVHRGVIQANIEGALAYDD